MGYTVLYIAFGIVALWLLGEVLLQYKAPLYWRALAFAGFCGLVAGVAMRDVVVIGLGTVAFAIGQTFVTVFYRRGFSMGWALGGGPGESRRRRGGLDDEFRSEPTLQVTEVEPVPDRPGPAGYAEASEPGYQPRTILDDTGEYAAYDRQPQPSPYGAPYGDPYAGQDPLGDGYGGHNGDGYGGGYNGADQTTAMPTYGDQGYQGQGYPDQGYQGQQGYPDPDYQDPQYQEPQYQDQTAAMPLFRDQAYPDQGYQNPSYPDQGYQDQDQDQGQGLGRGAYLGPDSSPYPQATYLDPAQYQQQPGPQAQPYQDPYADPYGTPPGGVWVPQQQNGEQQFYPPPPAADQAGYDPYRY